MFPETNLITLFMVYINIAEFSKCVHGIPFPVIEATRFQNQCRIPVEDKCKIRLIGAAFMPEYAKPWSVLHHTCNETYSCSYCDEGKWMDPMPCESVCDILEIDNVLCTYGEDIIDCNTPLLAGSTMTVNNNDKSLTVYCSNSSWRLKEIQTSEIWSTSSPLNDVNYEVNDTYKYNFSENSAIITDVLDERNFVNVEEKVKENSDRNETCTIKWETDNANLNVTQEEVAENEIANEVNGMESENSYKQFRVYDNRPDLSNTQWFQISNNSFISDNGEYLRISVMRDDDDEIVLWDL